MGFTTKKDLHARLAPETLQQLVGDDDEMLNNTLRQAERRVKEQLTALYDMDTALEKTGNERNAMLLWWIVSIALYDLYHLVPDEEVPARIIKDYDDTKQELMQLAMGKRSSTLPLRQETKGTPQGSLLRYGAPRRRSHE